MDILNNKGTPCILLFSVMLLGKAKSIKILRYTCLFYFYSEFILFFNRLCLNWSHQREKNPRAYVGESFRWGGKKSLQSVGFWSTKKCLLFIYLFIFTLVYCKSESKQCEKYNQKCLLNAGFCSSVQFSCSVLSDSL